MSRNTTEDKKSHRERKEPTRFWRLHSGNNKSRKRGGGPRKKGVMTGRIQGGPGEPVLASFLVEHSYLIRLGEERDRGVGSLVLAISLPERKGGSQGATWTSHLRVTGRGICVTDP